MNQKFQIKNFKNWTFSFGSESKT